MVVCFFIIDFFSVLIVIAMDAEAKPFVEHLELEVLHDFFPPTTPFKAYGGTHTTLHNNNNTPTTKTTEDGVVAAVETTTTTTTTITSTEFEIITNVTVIVNGVDTIYGTGVDSVGTVPASLSTYLALQKLTAASSTTSTTGVAEEENATIVVINAGTCGGFRRKNANIGDVYVTTAVMNHDRRIPIPPFVPYGIGHLPSTLSIEQLELLANQLQFKLGICSTGNSLDCTPVCDEIMIQNNVTVKDMEAAAISYVCAMFQNPTIPYIGLKVVTDIVDGEHPTQDEFLQNLHTASVQLQKALPTLLDYVSGKDFVF